MVYRQNLFSVGRVAVSLLFLLLTSGRSHAAINLLSDGSFEQPMPRDQFGNVFRQWGGWKYEGDCEFRVGRVAHSGDTSALMFGGGPCKIRLSQTVKAVPPGRYRVTAFIRGLDVGEGQWHMSTEFAFDGKYMGLKKNGTFGWTPLTYVADVKEKKDVAVSFGLWAAGYFWIDDVSLEPVAADVLLTDQPVIGKEEHPIEPPGELTGSIVRCPDCGYRNRADAHTCFACGAELTGTPAARSGPDVKSLADFAQKNPFSGGTLVAEHAGDGRKALRIDSGYAVWDGAQDWSGYDNLVADLYTDATRPTTLSIEIADQQTRGYWTRVNYETVVPPGKSTLTIPLAQLYVGEKARPGRNLMLSGITRLVLSIGEKPEAPLYVDHLRLERDTQTPKMTFDGLYAFSLGSSAGPLMPGFTRVDPGTLYSKGRGFGLKDAHVWRVFDARQPDPLYQNFICIEKGGLALDVPNGRYHVFVNIDSPSGFWGEYQTYRHRAVLAEGKPVVDESMTFDAFQRHYFRHWDTEDLPADDTFDKYQKTYFHEKQFDVDVTDGQLRLDFSGDAFACSVSAVVVYPADKGEQGRRFLDYVTARRRFYFDNYFHRVLHKPTGDPLAPSDEDRKRGCVVFSRDYMEDVYYNDTPRKDEAGKPVAGFAMRGQDEPITASVVPLRDLGKLSVTCGDLTGPGTIPAAGVSVGYVTYRVTRVSADGAVYTISPRLVMPRNGVDAPAGVTRRFWCTVHVPADAKPGVYRGMLHFSPASSAAFDVPVEFRVFGGTLDPADLPIGPFSHTIDTPWDSSDPAAQRWNRTMAERSLRKLHDCGFTSFTGMPEVRYLGFKDGKPQFDFSRADEQMKLARDCGFTMPVVTYVGLPGLDLYFKDEAAMTAAGIHDYAKFVGAVFGAIQAHADASHWLPVYWNIGDEPVGDDVTRAAENAESYRAAFPKGPPWFTAPTSFDSGDPSDPHFRFAKALHAVAFNVHTEKGIRMLHDAGSDWGFYNGGNRWTYGVYLFKAAKQFDCKFRISWHWNATAGDPYYALDCREDDTAWCNTNADGELIPSVDFEREFRAGLNDYRYLITLNRLAGQKNDAAARSLIADRMNAFHLGQREHNELFPPSDWREYRRKVAEQIERLDQ